MKKLIAFLIVVALAISGAVWGQPVVTHGTMGLSTLTAGQIPVATSTGVYGAASGSTAFPGTAANLAGTPAVPNGTTATTQAVRDDSTKLATTAFVQANKAMYYRTASTTNASPADATGYVYGTVGGAPATQAGKSAVRIERAGILKEVSFTMWNWGGTSPANPSGDSILTVELYNSNRTLKSSTQIATEVLAPDSNTVLDYTATLSLAVAAGELVEIKWLTPTWGTNPTSMYLWGQFVVE